MFPFAGPAIRRLNLAGFAVILVTNQSGVARGYFPESLVQQVNQRMQHQLATVGAHLDGIYYCPHASADDCQCRKPKLGMILQAARDHHLDVARSYVVGDRYSDVELAYRAGCASVFVRTGYGLGEETWHSGRWPRQPHAIVEDLTQAVGWILAHNQ